MILIDIDTQIDFLLPAGALYVPGAERLIPVLGKIVEGARNRSIPVISSADAHAENDPEFAHWPAHCVRGTLGQQKTPGTLLRERAVIPSQPGARIPQTNTPQIIVEKQALDVFSNPNFPLLLDQHPEEECVVMGVATDYCVQCAIDGLLKHGRRVTIVTDAIRGIDAESVRRVLDQAGQRGARLTTSSALWI